MPHFQRGYAIVHSSYELSGLETFDERYHGNDPNRRKLRTTKKNYSDDRIRHTYYAKCAKNETNDKYLSRWYSEIVRPKAERSMKKEIRAAQDTNDWDIRRWEEDMVRGNMASNRRKPNKIDYDAFEPRKLKNGKPRCVEKEPTGERARDVGWLPRRA